MLVVTRRQDEKTVIGDPKKPLGTVKVVKIKGEKVRLAFDFPREVEVHRQEVADQIVRKQKGVGDE